MDGEISFGHWLKLRRKALRLTQRELAQQVGCAQVTLRKIEADERRPSKQIARRLADLLALAPVERAAFVRAARVELCADQLPEPANIAGLTIPLRRYTNLPAPATPLIGREKDMAAVVDRLRRAEVRLLTLIGSPGIGKTRLGLQVASDLLDAFDDGCCFVALAPIRDPCLVATAIAQPLGVQELAGRPLAERLKHYLRDRHMLLLLDNFEQVAAAAPLVTELLTAAPGLKVLATSRATLRLSGEHEYLVPPLALPDLKRVPPIDELARFAAVDLFVQRMRAMLPDYMLTSATTTAVAEICHRLDGLPLAIELAAARGKLFSPQELLGRLSHRLELLTGGPRDLPARQQTLRNTIDWSYNLLDKWEQTLLRRLAVFVGGCTLDAAERVLRIEGKGPSDGSPNSVLDGLAALLDKSLLQQTEGTDGARRLGMLETINEYARELLKRSGEAEALRQRHAAYYLALAEEAEAHLWQSEQGVWLNRLELEHNNLRAALASSRTAAISAETGLRLAAALWPFWRIHGHLSEGRAWLVEFLSLTTKSNASLSIRVAALIGLGELAKFQNDYAAARAAYSEGLAIAREQGYTEQITRAVHLLGIIAWYQGDYAAARTQITESLDTWRALGNQEGSALALENLGDIAWYQGDYVASRLFSEQSLALRRELGDDVGATPNLHNLGKVARVEGDYARAKALHEASLALSQTQRFKIGTLWALHELGEVARDQGEYERAVALFEESMAIARDIGSTSFVASMQNRLGEIAQAQGDYARARALHHESLAVFCDLGQKRDSLLCLEGLAYVAEITAQTERSAVLYGAVAALREATGAQVPPLDRASYARSVDRVRDRLGEAAFAKVWAEGYAMPLAQAIACTLSEDA
jgi:predicted ATPase/DNA-binding XRE family transcriptional regulator